MQGKSTNISFRRLFRHLPNMNKLSNVRLQPLEQSNYVKPLSLTYDQNGKPHKWDLLAVHDSVAVILYNTTREVLLLVKQFRPPVYVGNIPEEDRVEVIDTKKYPAELGITIECCAGIIDKKLTIAEIASEEIHEECGYKVHPDKLEKVAAYKTGVGTSGSDQTLFYCEVTDDMKDSDGGGVEEELIEVVEMSIPEVQEYMKSEVVASPPSFMYAMQWFLCKMKIPL